MTTTLQGDATLVSECEKDPFVLQIPLQGEMLSLALYMVVAWLADQTIDHRYRADQAKAKNFLKPVVPEAGSDLERRRWPCQAIVFVDTALGVTTEKALQPQQMYRHNIISQSLFPFTIQITWPMDLQYTTTTDNNTFRDPLPQSRSQPQLPAELLEVFPFC